MSQPKIILVAGPTASGKSAFALDLARQKNGVIINADALQIYAGFPLLSAQPSKADLPAAPHKLYGVIDAAEKSSAGIWRGLAIQAINDVVHKGQTPILVGGTGLYFRALLGGLADIPPIPDDVRKKVIDLYDQWGEEKFRAELLKLDPETSARLAPNDRQRSIRAYEVVLHTGKPLGFWHKKQDSGFRIQDSKNSLESRIQNSESHLLLPPRDTLYAACDKRFLQMINQGAVEEVKNMLARKLDPSLPAMKTLGVREITDYLHGIITLDEAIAKAQQATRNYAKRQLTWFRNQWKY